MATQPQDIYAGYGEYGNNGQGTDAQKSTNAYMADNYNPDFVNSEITRAKQVLANRAQAGMDTSEQQGYLNKLFASRDKYMKSYDYVASQAGSQAEGYFANQKGMLDSAKASQIAELEKVYADAVNDGKISIREAEKQFKEARAEIDRAAFQDQEYTRLAAEERGIGNSQQMIGLMQGDNARKNSLIRDTMSDRDLRINNIKDRINAVLQKKNLDIANVNQQYDAGLLQARGQADMLKAEALQGLNMKNWELSEGNKYANEQMATQFDYKLKEMLKNQEYDLEKIDVQFKNELKAMGVQNSYQMAQISAQARASARAANDAYDLKMQRALNAFTPGTTEYKIAQAEAEAQKQADYAKAYNTNAALAQIEGITKNPVIGDGVIPTVSWWDNFANGGKLSPEELQKKKAIEQRDAFNAQILK